MCVVALVHTLFLPVSTVYGSFCLVELIDFSRHSLLFTSYDHWLEIRRELVLFPKIFRQFSEFVPTMYVGRIWWTKRNSEQIRWPKRNSAQIRNKFGDQKEIRNKFGPNSRRICMRSKLASAGGTQPATTFRSSRAHSSAGSAVAHAKGRRFYSTHEKLWEFQSSVQVQQSVVFLLMINSC